MFVKEKSLIKCPRYFYDNICIAIVKRQLKILDFRTEVIVIKKGPEVQISVTRTSHNEQSPRLLLIQVRKSENFR